MYSNILLVGGGLLFEGVESLLQYRVWLNLPPHIRHHTNVTVISRSKVCLLCIARKLNKWELGVVTNTLLDRNFSFHSYVTSSHNSLQQVAEQFWSCSSLWHFHKEGQLQKKTIILHIADR